MIKKINKKREKDFYVEQVASVVEVCYLTDADLVYEFCSFIIGEEINPGNIREYRDEIYNLVKLQYPTMKRTLYLANGECISKEKINEIVHNYRNTYGEIINIKSKSHEEIKTLIMKKEVN